MHQSQLSRFFRAAAARSAGAAQSTTVAPPSLPLAVAQESRTPIALATTAQSPHPSTTAPDDMDTHSLVPAVSAAAPVNKADESRDASAHLPASRTASNKRTRSGSQCLLHEATPSRRETDSDASSVPAAAAAQNVASPAPTQKRRRIEIATERDETSSRSANAKREDEQPSAVASAPRLLQLAFNAQYSKQSSSPLLVVASAAAVPMKRPPPDHWRQVWDGIVRMRSAGGVAADAPTDRTGAAAISAQIKGTSPATYRFQTLIGLILSAQTKDPDTAAAVARLRDWFQDKDGCTPTTVSDAGSSTLLRLIRGVTYAERKVDYLKRVAHTCRQRYKGDIPRTLEELCSLPGVGPKVAHLTLQHAWNDPQGIGVDVHVHRISNRLGWAQAADPEQTRQQLQEWLPHEYWAPINGLFVGFGQTICRAPFPSCHRCEVNQWCPYGRHRLRESYTPAASAEQLEGPAAPSDPVPIDTPSLL